MKTKEELNKIKEEVEAVNEKLNELTPEELEQVNGGGRAHLREHVTVAAAEMMGIYMK